MLGQEHLQGPYVQGELRAGVSVMLRHATCSVRTADHSVVSGS